MAGQINITLPDGAVRQYDRGMTGQGIAQTIGKGLARDALAASVDGQTWDMFRPIERDASVVFLTWEDDEGKRTF